MPNDGEKQPIIIKKVVKGGHGHHGGAWKIAYADFVTAMMAFFLLLWLLNSVTQESLEGISNYFAPITTSSTTSGSGGVLGGKTITEEGAAISATARDALTVDLPPPRAGTGGDLSEGEQAEESGDPTDNDPANPTKKQLEQAAAQREQQQFDSAKQQLEEALAGLPNLKRLRDSLLIDNTPEGLRIQLIDRDGLAMFPSGGSEMFLHAQRLLEVVSKVILDTTQDLSISGHTDATPFIVDSQNANWKLSSDRANAARAQLQRFNVPEDRVARIVGLAAREPLLSDDPKHPSNRRLSIVLLRGTGPQAKAGAERKAKAKEEPEALPGLNEIRREQGGTVPPAGLPGINLEIQQGIQTQ